MTYLISFQITSHAERNFTQIQKALRDSHGVELSHSAWLVESDQSAMELYLTLREHFDERFDHVVVAEITSNTFGSYVAENHKLLQQIAEMIGHSRRR